MTTVTIDRRTLGELVTIAAARRDDWAAAVEAGHAVACPAIAESSDDERRAVLRWCEETVLRAERELLPEPLKHTTITPIEEPDERYCPNAGAHEWGHDRDRDRVYCLHCGADGDA